MSMDEEQRKYYFSFVKRFKGLEKMREFADHLNVCPECLELFSKIVLHMEEKRRG